MTLLRAIIPSILICFSALLYCQAPVDSTIIKFSSTTYDFGSIYEADSSIEIKFTFSNSRNTALKINKVYSPGLPIIEFPQDSIFSAKENTLTFQLNPFGQPGYLKKTIYIFSNAINSPVILTVKGKIFNGSFPIIISIA